MRAGLSCLLGSQGEITVVAESRSGEETLGLVAKLAPDVLLLDAEMPDLSGVEVARRLDEVRSPVRLVVLADEADEQVAFELLASGVTGFVTKRDDPEAIIQAVRAACRGDEIWLSPRLATRLVPRPGRSRRLPGTAPLSPREREILQHLAHGHGNERIAKSLGLTCGTVRNHLSNIYRKLGISARSEAVAWAWRHGLAGDEAPHR